MKTTLIVLIALSSFILSCRKEKTADDFTPPSISITLPTAGQQFNTLDTVWLDAMITDESEISDVTVRVLYGGDSILIWPTAPVVFGNVKQYHLDDHVINNISVPSPTTATLRIYATDKRDNTATKDVSIELL